MKEGVITLGTDPDVERMEALQEAIEWYNDGDFTFDWADDIPQLLSGEFEGFIECAIEHVVLLIKEQETPEAMIGWSEALDGLIKVRDGRAKWDNDLDVDARMILCDWQIEEDIIEEFKHELEELREELDEEGEDRDIEDWEIDGEFLNETTT